MNHTESQGIGKVRLDKWLWAARFYKTRSISAEEIDKGRVRVNGATVKPARELRVGDTVEMRSGPLVRTVTVRALSGVRGPAPVAALLYQGPWVAERHAVIEALLEVSTFTTPSTWTVRTDRGTTTLVLKGEEDIRRLADGRLLVADSQGIQFVIADRQALDRHSRRILERFL